MSALLRRQKIDVSIDVKTKDVPLGHESTLKRVKLDTLLPPSLKVCYDSEDGAAPHVPLRTRIPYASSTL